MKLEADAFNALLADFRQSLFRLETLSMYAVPTYDERYRAFRAGRPLAPPPPAKQAWLGKVAEATAAGRRIYRAHVLEPPLSDYLRYELTVYQENTAAGEEVYIVDRSWHTEATALQELTNDFLLIDDAVVVWYAYDADGQLVGYERSDLPEDLHGCRRQRDTALAHAVNLNEYLPTTDLAPPRYATA